MALNKLLRAARLLPLVVEKDGRYVEIQLRTPWQDSWAQSVEQDTRRLRKGLAREPQEIEIARRSGNGGFRGLGDRRLESLDFSEHGGGVKQEIAAVPEIMIAHVVRRAHGVRLLHKRFDREH